MKLYEITSNYRNFMEAVENGLIPEECIADTLEAIEGVFEEKADNIACLYKELVAESKAIKDEMDSLKSRYESKTKRAEFFKNYLSESMQALSIASCETSRNKITFRASKALEIEDEREFVSAMKDNRDDLLTFNPPVPDKNAIKKAIADGEKFEGVQIVTRKNIQIK